MVLPSNNTDIVVYGNSRLSIGDELTNRLENSANDIKHLMRKDGIHETNSLEDVISKNKATLNKAVDCLQDFPCSDAYYFDKYTNMIMKDTLETEIKELKLVSNFNDKEAHDDIVSLGYIDDERDVESNDDEKLAELRRTQIKFKSNLEYVLDTMYPEMKDSIKEILSILEQAKNDKEGDGSEEFNDPELIPVLTLLEKAAIIELFTTGRYKLATCDLIG